MKLKKAPATIQKLEKEIAKTQKSMLRVYAKFAQLECREQELLKALRAEAKSAKFELGRVHQFGVGYSLGKKADWQKQIQQNDI